MRVQIGENTRMRLDMLEWDTDELEQVLPLMYPDKKQLLIIDCNKDYIYCIIDDKLHILNERGDEQPVDDEYYIWKREYYEDTNDEYALVKILNQVDDDVLIKYAFSERKAIVTRARLTKV